MNYLRRTGKRGRERSAEAPPSENSES
jgi:hypothetical protein